jgi:hypothetical protein
MARKWNSPRKASYPAEWNYSPSLPHGKSFQSGRRQSRRLGTASLSDRRRHDDRGQEWTYYRLIGVAWFTLTGDLTRLYIASSSDHGVTFGKPQLLDPGQKLAKHATS